MTKKEYAGQSSFGTLIKLSVTKFCSKRKSFRFQIQRMPIIACPFPSAVALLGILCSSIINTDSSVHSRSGRHGVGISLRILHQSIDSLSKAYRATSTKLPSPRLLTYYLLLYRLHRIGIGKATRAQGQVASALLPVSPITPPT